MLKASKVLVPGSSIMTVSDVDLLFMQTIVKSGVPIEGSNSAGMGFHEFCDALLEIARRKMAHAKSDGDASITLPAALERIVLALPGAAEAAERHAASQAAAAASVAGKGGGTTARRDSRELSSM